eukprot:gene13474-9641_t
MQGDPLDASLVLTLSGVDPETEYRERERCLRSLTNFTQQPRSSTNGCCLLASLDPSQAKTAPAGAYRRQPGEKYGYTGLRAWLEHLVEQEVLSGFTLSTVDSLTANAAELLEGAAERASAYQQTLEIEAHAICVRAEIKLAWEWRIRQLRDRDRSIRNEATAQLIGTAPETSVEADRAAHSQFEANVARQVRGKLGDVEGGPEVAETVLKRFKDGCSVAHLRFSLRRNVMRLPAHGVCLRTNGCAKEMLLLDPAGTKVHLLSKLSLQLTTEALMRAVVD